jgi:hypothetical protein
MGEAISLAGFSLKHVLCFANTKISYLSRQGIHQTACKFSLKSERFLELKNKNIY